MTGGSDRSKAGKEVLEPGRRIIDPHMHLWDIPTLDGGLQEAQTFLVREAADAIQVSGHCVTHTVFVECHAMYRPSGPPELRSLGETEFAVGMAAMAESGLYGPSRIAHRIVAHVDLGMGDALAPVLETHRARAPERLRGVRMNTSFSEAGLFGAPAEPGARTRLENFDFIRGAGVLAQMGLSLDVWCLHRQLSQLIALARAVPDLSIILDHVGTPDRRGAYRQQAEEAWEDWRGDMRTLSLQPNVRVKISGLGMDVSRPLSARTGTAPSQMLAQEWRARVETVIDSFGPARCMFASNYPADRSAGCYGAIWNAFKLLAEGYSEAEKEQLFRTTAAEAYHIDLTD